MFKRGMLILSIVFIFSLSCQRFSYGENNKKVLLLYDQRRYFGDKQEVVYYFRKLLEEFNIDITEKDEESYIDNEIINYDYIFIIGLEGSLKNKPLIRDIKNTKKTICWIGKGVNKYLENNKNTNLEFKGIKRNIIIITHTIDGKKKRFEIGNERDFVIVEDPLNQIEIYSTISDGLKEYPYILKENNLWYISRLEIESVLFFIIKDTLYDLFEVNKLQRNNGEDKIETLKISEENRDNTINKYFAGIINLLGVFIAIVCLIFLVILLQSKRRSDKNIFR